MKRSNPFDRLDELFERMSRQFEDAARTWESTDLPALDTGFESMALDIADHDDEFVVTVDVPGFTKDEIDVRVADQALRIDAEHEETTEEGDEEYLRKERREKSLHRMVRLPEMVDDEAITATVKNGVLTINVPKAEPMDEAKRIEIEGE